MKAQLTISRFLLAASLLVLPAARAAAQNQFHFWFQRDGACVACRKMPPPGQASAFPQMAGIDVMFNGYYQAGAQHWQNQNVQSYQVTYTYTLNGTSHSVTQSAAGNAASVIIKPYGVSDLNTAQIVSISVAATFASGTVTKTASSPQAFHVY